MKLRRSANFFLYHSMQLGYMTLYFAIFQMVFMLLKANFNFQLGAMDTRD